MVYLNDKVVKKALSTNNPYINEYIKNIISTVTGVPKYLLKNLELVYPEVGYNTHTVNSITDLAYKTNTHFFSIEINYRNKSKTRNISNIFYVYQLNLKQVTNAKDYSKLLPVYQIQLNYEDYFGKGDLLYTVSTYEEKYHIPYLENPDKLFILNLSYFKNKSYTNIRKEEKKFFKLFYIFICEDRDKLNEFYKDDEIMKEVKETFDTLGKVIDGNLYLDPKKYYEQVSYEDGQADAYIETAKRMLN